MLANASGHSQKCYTPLVSYIADLPEQQLIACVSKNASPVTVAELPQFGDPTPAEPRRRNATLQQIKDLCAAINPWDLAAFQKAAKLIKLLRVHKPFWCNWKFAEPFLFLTCEVLHTLHKFFYNHIVEWCKFVTGSHTLDICFMNLHQCISFCHFVSSVSHQPQMSGREQRDMESKLVLILDGAGTASDDFIYAIRAMLEFICIPHAGSRVYQLIYHSDGTSTGRFSLQEAVHHRYWGAKGYERNHQSLQHSKDRAHDELCMPDESKQCTYPVYGRHVRASTDYALQDDLSAY